jgi:hypothetical protein
MKLAGEAMRQLKVEQSETCDMPDTAPRVIDEGAKP